MAVPRAPSSWAGLHGRGEAAGRAAQTAVPHGDSGRAGCEVGASVCRYRAPELLLGSCTQTTSIDMW